MTFNLIHSYRSYALLTVYRHPCLNLHICGLGLRFTEVQRVHLHLHILLMNTWSQLSHWLRPRQCKHTILTTVFTSFCARGFFRLSWESERYSPWIPGKKIPRTKFYLVVRNKMFPSTRSLRFSNNRLGRSRRASGAKTRGILTCFRYICLVWVHVFSNIITATSSEEYRWSSPCFFVSIVIRDSLVPGLWMRLWRQPIKRNSKIK